MKSNTFDRNRPYNDLPPLPPKAEVETRATLKRAAAASKELGELKGLAAVIPNQTILINALTLQEAKDSSEIENVLTTTDKLYKALSTKDETTDPATKEVLRYREALWEGHRALADQGILSTNLFVRIQNIITNTSASIRKTPGTKIADSQGRVIYTPPEGESLIRDKLHNLEQFIHEDGDGLDKLVKMAIVHYQFEAIHPFTDGNGRTGRILSVLYLVKEGYLDTPILYLSRYIIEHKNRYYRLLQRVTEERDWSDWLLFMLEAVEKTANSARKKILQIRDLLNDAIDRARKELPSYMYSKELIELLFEQPYCKIQFLVEKGIARRQRASVYLKELEKIGLLESQKIGRENLFLNKGLHELLSAPD